MYVFSLTGNHGFPVDCLTTDFGCCGDNLTPRTDPSGKNCPKCKDMVPELCEPHVNDCNEIGMVGNWMRANCKKSCEVCVPGREAGGWLQFLRLVPFNCGIYL